MQLAARYSGACSRRDRPARRRVEVQRFGIRHARCRARKTFHQTVDNAVGRRIFNSMVDYKPDIPNSPHLDGVFQALSDPTRRAMLQALAGQRSEEHTSELQSLMRISYAVFCLKKKKNTNYYYHPTQA